MDVPCYRIITGEACCQGELTAIVRGSEVIQASRKPILQLRHQRRTAADPHYDDAWLLILHGGKLVLYFICSVLCFVAKGGGTSHGCPFHQDP